MCSNKKKSALLFISFHDGEPVWAAGVWGVFWWRDDQGAVDGEQVIVHTVQIVMHTCRIYRQCFICLSQVKTEIITLTHHTA